VDEEELNADLVFEPRKRKLVTRYNIDDEEADSDRKPKKRRDDTPPTNGFEIFSEKEIRGVHRGVMKFGLDPNRLDLVIEEAGTRKKKEDVLYLIDKMTEATKAALEKEKEQAPKVEVEDDDKDDKPKEKEKEGVDVIFGGFTFRSTWLQRIDDLVLLKKKIGYLETACPLTFSSHPLFLSFFLRADSDQGTSFRFQVPLFYNKEWKDWGPDNDAMLAVGANKHGFGCWKAIREDTDLGLAGRVFDGEKDENGKVLLPQPPHMARRMEYLLKVIRDQEKDQQKKKALGVTFTFSGKRNPEPSGKEAESNEVIDMDDAPATNDGEEQDKEKAKPKPKDKSQDENPKEKKEKKEKSVEALIPDKVVLDEKSFGECQELMRPVDVCAFFSSPQLSSCR